jgi:hypothetical protein
MRKSKKSEDEDDELTIKGLRQYDGSQDVLHVYRILSRLDRAFSRELKIKAHLEIKWRPICDEAYQKNHYIPHAMPPKLRGRGSEESDESWGIRKVDFLDKKRSYEFESRKKLLEFRRDYAEKEEKKLAKAVKLMLSMVKGSAYDELNDIESKSPVSNPLFPMWSFMETNWLQAPQELAAQLHTAYIDFKCDGNPGKAILKLSLKKRQYEISNKTKVTNVAFIDRILSFIPTDVPLYWEEVQRLRGILTKLIQYCYDFEKCDVQSFDEEDDMSVITTAENIDFESLAGLTITDDDIVDADVYPMEEEVETVVGGGDDDDVGVVQLNLGGAATAYHTPVVSPRLPEPAIPVVNEDAVPAALARLEARLLRMEIENSNLKSKLAGGTTEINRVLKEAYILENAPKLTLKALMEKFKALYLRWQLDVHKREKANLFNEELQQRAKRGRTRTRIVSSYATSA